MHLDPVTVLVIGVFVGGLMSAVLAVVDLGLPRRIPGLHEAVAACVLQTAVTVLFALQATGGPRVLTVFLANSLYVSGFGVLFVAFRLLSGRPTRAVPVSGLVVVATCLFAHGTFWVDSMAYRLVVQSGPEMILLSVAAWSLLRASVPARPTGRWLVAASIGFDVVVSAARTVVVVVSGAPGTMAEVDGVLLGYVVLHVVAFAGMGVGLTLIAHERLREELERQAWHDSLTGAYTRRVFFELAERERVRCSRSGEAYALVMVDLDHFKELNDRLGHQAGDLFLSATAAALRGVLRPSDVLGRYGGEEFIVLLHSASVADAFRVGERLRAAVAGVILDAEPDHRGTASVGVAGSDSAGEDLDVVLRRADAALYRAKGGGRDRVEREQAGAPGA
jgi:diguanylate cyclase (GGDEF)-like protein